MKISFIIRVFLISVVYLSGSIVPVLAQISQPKNKLDSISRDINPVQLSNIGTATEETLAKLREFRNQIKISSDELVLDSIIPLSLEKVENWQSSLKPEEIEEMQFRQIETIKIEFENFRQSLGGWRESFTSKTEEIVKVQIALAEMRARWQRTLDLERQEKLPEQVTIRIKDNLAEIDKVSQSISDRNNNLLTKQTELTSALIYVDDILNEVVKVERSYKEQLFVLDMPPLWKIFSDQYDSTSFNTQFATVLQKHKDDLKSFKSNYLSNIYWHILIFIVLVVLTYLLKSEVDKWPDEKKGESVGSSLVIIKQPLSSALLIALLSSGLFYPGVSPDILNYYYILLIIPLLRVIPNLLPGIDKKYLYFVAAALFISQLGDHFSEIIIIVRIELLLVDILSLFIIFQVLRNGSEIAKKNINIRWSFVFNILRVASLLIIISILANIIGNTFFSRVISRGTLYMVYGGILIYTGILVIRGLFNLLIQERRISRLNMIKNYSSEVRHHVFRVINIVAVLYWLFITLDGYLIYDALFEWTTRILTHEWIIGSVSLSIGSILAFFITLWISLLISRFVRFILQDEILTHFELPRGVPGAISMIVRLVLIFLGFILAFGAAKIDMSNIAIIFGALGVGIGFGLQNIFNNLVSGLILAFERPVQVGDIIQISSINLWGEVKEIGIRASIVRTFDGAEIVVPNGNLISNEMINWTLSDSRRRQEITVGVAYGTPTEKVLEVLSTAVSGVENVLQEPAPIILFTGFGESSLDFKVLFWSHIQNGFITKSEVGVAIDTAFKQAGIQIPFPQRDLHLVSATNKPTLAKTTKTTGSKKKAD